MVYKWFFKSKDFVMVKLIENKKKSKYLNDKTQQNVEKVHKSKKWYDSKFLIL